MTTLLTYTLWDRQAERFYGYSTYKKMHVEIFEKEPGVFDWSFYDDKSDDPDLAVARNDDDFSTAEDAEADMLDYIDGYVAEER